MRPARLSPGGGLRRTISVGGHLLETGRGDAAGRVLRQLTYIRQEVGGKVRRYEPSGWGSDTFGHPRWFPIYRHEDTYELHETVRPVWLLNGYWVAHPEVVRGAEQAIKVIEIVWAVDDLKSAGIRGPYHEYVVAMGPNWEGTASDFMSFVGLLVKESRPLSK